VAGVLTASGATAGLDADEALALAARDRPELFGRLYERYLPRVYRYLAARAPSREEAADLTQLTFTRAFAALAGFRPGKAPFAAWLFGIARNAAADAARRRRRQAPWDGAPQPPQANDEALPEETLLHQERLQRLRGLLAGLPAQQRELLALRFAGGLSARQIAPIIGKKEEAVKRQMSRILASLKEKYHDDL